MEIARDRKIDYIEFTTKDIQRTKLFYQQVFGWSFEDYGPEYTSFSDGRIAGGFQKGELQNLSGPLVVIYVADLEATERSIKSAGGAITKEPLLVSRWRALSLSRSGRK